MTATCLLYVLWFVVPGLILAPLFMRTVPESYRGFLENLPLLWLLLCVGVLFQVIFTSRLHHLCHHNVLLNVVASVAVGGVTVGLALVAFSISFVDLPKAMSTDGTRQVIEAPAPPPDGRLPKRRYVFALDVSKSFVTPKEKKDERLNMARDLAVRLFVPAGQLGSLVKPEDCTVVMVFAGTFSAGTDHCKELFDPVALPDLIVQQLSSKVASQSDHPDKTDLVRFLEALIAELEVGEHEPTTIFLLSDLRQDATADAPSDDDSSRLRSLRARLHSIPDLRFFVVVDDLTGARGHRLKREDLDLPEDRWQEVAWNVFKNADREEQLSALALGIYREEKPLETMYLKYYFSLRQEGIPSSIELPRSAGYENVVLGLIPEGGDEDAARRLKIRVAFDDDPRMLSMESAAARSVILPKTTGALSISLSGAQDVQRFVRCNLLIAVPGRSVMYKVPISVIPTFRGAACNLFKSLALAMVAILAILGLFAALAYASHRLRPHAYADRGSPERGAA